MSNEIVQYGDNSLFMPVMSIETAITRYNSIVGFVKKLMVEGTDYGKIPGTGDKPVLLKPGAEKLSTLFGLAPIFVATEVVEDWTGKNYDGEPMFYYRYKCELYRGGTLIATSEGSCNSRESKYRYRKSERICPTCEQPAIMKSKPPKVGWYCWSKRGGCGAQFNAGDPRIEEQEVGRVANPDIADQVNTIQKMAQKRALVAAVLLAVNASEFFTQDIEDIVDTSYQVIEDTPAPATTQNPPPQVQHRQPRQTAASTSTTPAPVVASDPTKQFHARIASTFGGLDVDAARHWYISKFTNAEKSSTTDCTPEEMILMAEDLRKNTASTRRAFVEKQAEWAEIVTESSTAAAY